MSATTYIGPGGSIQNPASGAFEARANWSENDNDYNRTCIINGASNTVTLGASVGKIGSLIVTDASLQLNVPASIGHLVVTGAGTMQIGTPTAPVTLTTGPATISAGAVVIVPAGSSWITGGAPIEVLGFGGLVVVGGTVDVTNSSFSGTVHGSGLSVIILDGGTVRGNLNAGGQLRVQHFHGPNSTVTGDVHTGMLASFSVMTNSNAQLNVGGQLYMASAPSLLQLDGGLGGTSYQILNVTQAMSVPSDFSIAFGQNYGMETGSTPPYTIRMQLNGTNAGIPVVPPPVVNPADGLGNDDYLLTLGQTRLRNNIRTGFPRADNPPPPSPPPTYPPYSNGTYRLRNSVRLGYTQLDVVGVVPYGAPTTAPTVSITAEGGGLMLLTWPNIPLATSYNVFRGTSSGGEGIVPYRSVPTSFLLDTGIPLTSYWYIVVPVNQAGSGSASVEKSVVCI
jgi:hypothetical protein